MPKNRFFDRFKTLNKIRNSAYYRKFKLIMNVIIPFGFAVYNGVLGFYFNIIWSQAILAYYLLLLLVRFSLTLSLNKSDEIKKIVHISGFVVILVLNVSLVTPAILMLKSQKPVNVDVVFSIANALYTTYSIIKSIYEFKKYKNDDNIIFKDLKLVSLINAIVSILTLQNTLIMVNGGMNQDMAILSTVSTICLLMLCLAISIYSFFNDKGKYERRSR